MDDLTPAQMKAKVLYLEGQNAKLSSQVLDLSVRLGLIKLKDEEASDE